MKQTIAQLIKEEMINQGYTYVGITEGWMSKRKGSNLYKFLERNSLLDNQNVVVRSGAKRQHKTEGTELLIFVLKV